MSHHRAPHVALKVVPTPNQLRMVTGGSDSQRARRWEAGEREHLICMLWRPEGPECCTALPPCHGPGHHPGHQLRQQSWRLLTSALSLQPLRVPVSEPGAAQCPSCLRLAVWMRHPARPLSYLRQLVQGCPPCRLFWPSSQACECCLYIAAALQGLGCVLHCRWHGGTEHR